MAADHRSDAGCNLQFLENRRFSPVRRPQLEPEGFVPGRPLRWRLPTSSASAHLTGLGKDVQMFLPMFYDIKRIVRLWRDFEGPSAK